MLRTTRFPSAPGGLTGRVVILAVAVLGGVLAVAGYLAFRSEPASPAPAGRTTASRGQVDEITTLEERISRDPQNLDAHLSLAAAYLQKVRESGDPRLYGAAENVLARAAKLDPQSPDVWVAQARLAQARHDFAGALAAAQRALALDPERALYWGIVADAQVELGMYSDALKSLQEMVNRRPDFSSFSRISYVRELYGDPEGAIEAMESAMAAGSAVPENMAWARVQIGNLYMNLNNPREAERQYALALETYPGLAAALAGQARLAAANEDLQLAADRFAAAFASQPLTEYAIGLEDVLQVMGQQAQAAKQYALIDAMDRLQRENGVNTDMELALYQVDHGIDPEGTLARARRAYAARPSIFAADVLAWALYKSGQVTEARQYSQEAMRLGSRDPLLLFRAGMIAAAAGEREEAFARLEEALRLNPHLTVLYEAEARAKLAEVQPR